MRMRSRIFICVVIIRLRMRMLVFGEKSNQKTTVRMRRPVFFRCHNTTAHAQSRFFRCYNTTAHAHVLFRLEFKLEAVRAHAPSRFFFVLARLRVRPLKLGKSAINWEKSLSQSLHSPFYRKM